MNFYSSLPRRPATHCSCRARPCSTSTSIGVGRGPAEQVAQGVHQRVGLVAVEEMDLLQCLRANGRTSAPARRRGRAAVAAGAGSVSRSQAQRSSYRQMATACARFRAGIRRIGGDVDEVMTAGHLGVGQAARLGAEDQRDRADRPCASTRRGSISSGGPTDWRRNRPPVRAEVAATSTQSATASPSSGDDAAAVQDVFAVRGELPGPLVGGVGDRSDQHEVGQAHVAHDAGRRPEVGGDLRAHQDDAAVA